MQLNTRMRKTRSMSDILSDQGVRTRARIIQGRQLDRHVEREHWHTLPAVHTNLPSIQQLNPTLPVAHSTLSSVQRPSIIASPVFSTPSSVQQPTSTLPAVHITSPLILQPIVVPAIVQRLSFSPPLVQPSTTPPVHPNTTPPIQPSTTLPAQATYRPPLVQSNPLGQLSTDTHPLRQGMPTRGFSMRRGSSLRIQVEDHYIDVATTGLVQPNTTPVHPNTATPIQPSTTLPAQAMYSPPLVQSTPLGQHSTDTHPLLQGMPTRGFSMRRGSSSCMEEEDTYINDATTGPVQPSTTPPDHPNTTTPIQPSTTLPTQASYSQPLVQSSPLGQPSTNTHPLHQGMPTQGFSMRQGSSSHIQERDPYIDAATSSPVHPNTTPPLHPNTTPPLQPNTTLLAQATYSPPLIQSTQLGRPNTDTHPLRQHRRTRRFSMMRGSSSRIQEEDAYIDEAYGSMEEDPTGVEDIPAEEPLQYDNAGRVIILPHGTGWIPSDKPVEAIGCVIQSHFEGPYPLYDAVPNDMKEKWWTEFMKKITWAPHHECEIRYMYNKHVKRCLHDMLHKVRQKGTKPHWIGEAAWSGLLTYWESPEFKDNSSQNETNRASAQVGVVHTTGRTSHQEMTFRLTRNLYQPANPDELFTGGETRGQCYGTEHLACNAPPGVSSLTQESRFGPGSSGGFQHLGETEALLQEVQEAAERADAAAAQAEAATTALAEANQKYAHLEEQLKLVQEQLCMVLDRQSGGTSTSPSQVHPNYDEDLDDHPLDEEGAPARQRRRY